MRWSAERLMVERLRRLAKWRAYVGLVAKAARDVLGGDARVYVVGGAAEDRLTAASDIDIVIVHPRLPPPASSERVRLVVRVREVAVDRYGLPWDYPVDLKVMTPGEFEEARRHYYRRVIEVSGE